MKKCTQSKKRVVFVQKKDGQIKCDKAWARKTAVSKMKTAAVTIYERGNSKMMDTL